MNTDEISNVVTETGQTIDIAQGMLGPLYSQHEPKLVATSVDIVTPYLSIEANVVTHVSFKVYVWLVINYNLRNVNRKFAVIGGKKKMLEPIQQVFNVTKSPFFIGVDQLINEIRERRALDLGKDPNKSTYGYDAQNSIPPETTEIVGGVVDELPLTPKRTEYTVICNAENNPTFNDEQTSTNPTGNTS